MQPSHTDHTVPRAGLDPIDNIATALSTVSMAIHQPPRPETIVLLLDHQRCGFAVVVVAGTLHRDDVLDVLEFITEQARRNDELGAVVIASVRPGEPDEPDRLDDIDRWLELSHVAELAGVELLEWFVFSAGVSCPRELLDEPSRWSSTDAVGPG